ncbi:Receptor-like protein kinase THESEUS 1 [Sesamum angolense]|uniref:non-specific serine/threonine protein kinase n=1 Tax=Sesamum angolense TaxID=2727404 RepID=A0AAE1X677_9LAMI|nr:Receptor-like protein kinase THESEUS 1 [Sesamum angolense]
MGSSFAAICGGVGGGITLLGLVIFSVWYFMFQCRKLSNKDSETGSSDPSAVVEMKRGPNALPPLPGPYNKAREFRIEELEQASRQFNENNLIGFGTFGLVFKGLLNDGTVVAIKRRSGHPRQEFTEEVAYLSGIQHRNLVKLLGFCQEKGSQILVFEYLPNGSMCSHLYDTGKDSVTKLEFKQRLSIAIGAAKGLCHLHSLQPPVVHSNFKTANVLVDENFIAKVADAGVLKLLEKIEDAGSSSSSSFNAFRDPELGLHETFHDTNDIYSFGIFLLELISGKEATEKEAFLSNDSILQWVQEHLSLNDLVDYRLIGSFTAEGMRDLIRLMLKCMSFPGRERPRMGNLVVELDQILDKEMTRTTVMGEGMATVTLGSQLFT